MEGKRGERVGEGTEKGGRRKDQAGGKKGWGPGQGEH